MEKDSEGYVDTEIWENVRYACSAFVRRRISSSAACVLEEGKVLVGWRVRQALWGRT